jgi:hypothetical protein
MDSIKKTLTGIADLFTIKNIETTLDIDDWSNVESLNTINKRKYDDINWVGMTVDEVRNKITEVFNDIVRVAFVEEFREEELYMLNYFECKMVNGRVVETSWG